MTQSIVDVTFPFIYDFYYRTRNACLECEAYRIDFYDWVSAGIAFNTLGAKDPRRRVAYFGKIFDILDSAQISENVTALRTAIVRFYEDLYHLYDDHLVAQLKSAKSREKSETVEPKSLIILPSFSQVPQLLDFIPSRDVVLDTYECKHLEALREDMSTIYAVEGTPLFRGMSLMYDYGMKSEEDGIILGVK